MITQRRLKDLLQYDPETGVFIRRRSCGGFLEGTVAGSTSSYYGYIHISIDKKVYKAHRLAFLYMEGRFPEGEVDHKNGIRSDNSWNNLRECSRTENSKNCSLRSDNTSGCPGVGFHKKRGQWRARVGTKHLGWYPTKELAIEARNKEANNRGYSERHGQHGLAYNNSFRGCNHGC
jgi:hypothetical protein